MVKKETPKIKKLKAKTRNLSIKEGIFWTFRQAFGDHFISPFAIAIGSSNALVALINTMWNMSYLSQIFGVKLTNKISRKKIVSTGALINSLGFLIMGIIGIFYIKNILLDYLPIFILIDLFILLSATGIGHPAWFSLIGEVVNPKYRGRWWAKRSTIVTFMSISLTIIASFILEFFKKVNLEISGFIIFFGIAFLARFYCSRILKKHYEPRLKKSKKHKIKTKSFIKELKNTNFGKFILFRGLFTMSIMITSPLIAIYLLRYLNFDYPTYILISLSGMIFSFFTLNLWGKLADKYGNYKIIVISTMLIPIIPILWILSESKLYLFLIPGMIGGIGWYGFLLASKNFIYDNNSKEKTLSAVAHMNFFVGIGAILGGLISAALIKYINTTWIEPIILIFIIGAIIRMLIVSIFVPRFKEIKHKRKIKGFRELETIVIRQLRPTLIEDAHEVIAIKNYLKRK